MCGRYRPTLSWSEIHALYQLTLDYHPAPNLEPRYNAAPTMRLPVVRLDAQGRRRLDELRWGLVPFWAKDLKIGAQCINARADTVATKPAFREAFKRRRRCLVPAAAYYEWRTEAGAKQPYMIALADGGPMTFAGLWERWVPKPDPAAEGDAGAAAEPVETFTILTTEASPAAARVHDRMPVLLAPDAFEFWLTAPADVAAALLTPWPGALNIVPVNKAMSNVRNDKAEHAAPVGAALA